MYFLGNMVSRSSFSFCSMIIINLRSIRFANEEPGYSSLNLFDSENKSIPSRAEVAVYIDYNPIWPLHCLEFSPSIGGLLVDLIKQCYNPFYIVVGWSICDYFVCLLLKRHFWIFNWFIIHHLRSLILYCQGFSFLQIGFLGALSSLCTTSIKIL